MSLTAAAALTSLRVLIGVVGVGYAIYSNQTDKGGFNFGKIPEAIFGEAVGGLFAAWLKEGSEAAYKAFVDGIDRLGADNFRDDLQLAARKAYLSATYLACDSCISSLESERSGMLQRTKNRVWKDEDLSWLKAVKEYLQNQVQNVYSGQVKNTESKELFSGFEIFDSTVGKSYAEDVILRVKEEVLQEVKNTYYSKLAGQVAIPFSENGYDLLRDAVLNGWERRTEDAGALTQLNLGSYLDGTVGHVDWFSVLIGFFNEEYRSNARLQAGLLSKEVSEIRKHVLEDSLKGLESLTRLESKIDTLTDSVESLRIENHELHISTHDQLEALTALVKQQNQRVLEGYIEAHHGLTRVGLSMLLPVGSVLEQFTPPPMDGMVRRNEFTAELSAILGRGNVLFLYGSSGMGKSVLSYQVIEKEKGDWRSLDMREQPAAEVNRRFLIAAHVLQALTNPINLLIDDLNFDKDVDVYRKALTGLLQIGFQKRCNVVITSQNPMPTVIRNQFEFRDETFVSVPALSRNDVEKLATIHACPEGKILESWTKIIWSQTKGHPLLVHAQIINLKQNGWRNPKPEDFLAQPVLADVRIEFRRNLAEKLSESARLLLYRLSIFTGRFMRENAMALGEVESQITLVGEVFDSLVGPYVEPVDTSYFRLSPLLEGNASDLFVEDELKRLHIAAAESFLKQKTLTHTEFNAILVHGLRAEHGAALVKATMGWTSAPLDVKQSLAYYCEWFTFLGNDRPLFPSDLFVNQIVRNLQFDIGEGADAKKLIEIVQQWEKELEDFKRNQQNIPAFIPDSLETKFLQSVLFTTAVKFPWASVVRWMLRFIDAVSQVTHSYHEVGASHPELIAEHGAIPWPETMNHPKFILGNTFVKCKSAQDVLDLISAFDSLAGEEAERAWKLLNSPDASLSLLIDKIWLDYIHDRSHDWSETLEQLDYVIEVGQRRAEGFVIAGYVAKAIITREYLNDSNGAFSLLDSCNQFLGYSSCEIESYRATVHHIDKNDAEAVRIWNTVLPELLAKPSYERPYFVRNAQISASRLGDWETVSRFALTGMEIVDRTYQDLPDEQRPNHLSLSFLADNAIALWNLGRKREALLHIVEVFEELTSLSYSEFDNQEKILYLRLSYFIFWMAYPRDEAVRAGYFSNPESVSNLDKLPSYSRSFLWFLLSMLEFELRSDRTIFDKLSAVVKSNQHDESDTQRRQLIEFGHARLELRHAIRGHDLDDIIIRCYEMVKNFGDESLDSPETLSNLISELYRITFGAFVFFASEKRVETIPFDKWKADLVELSKTGHFSNEQIERLNRWIDGLRRSVGLNNHELFVELQKASQSDSTRLAAAASLVFADELTPSQTFYAGVLLVTFNFDSWTNLVDFEIERSITERWLEILEHPFPLRSPRHNVPIIREACVNTSLSGLSKAASILLAAQPSTGMSLPQSVRENLTLIVSQTSRLPL